MRIPLLVNSKGARGSSEGYSAPTSPDLYNEQNVDSAFEMSPGGLSELDTRSLEDGETNAEEEGRRRTRVEEGGEEEEQEEEEEEGGGGEGIEPVPPPAESSQIVPSGKGARL